MSYLKNLLGALLFTVVMVPVTSMASQESTINDQKAVEVTVYNSNLGLVKDTRKLKLGSGQGELRFMDVASAIMPVTVHVQPLNPKAGFSILEQNFEYDLMDQNKLLDKYVGKNIKLLTVNDYQGKKDIVEATLLSNNNGQIFKIGNEIYLGAPGTRILPQLPDDLIAKPTLTWMYDNPGPKEQDVQVSYLTSNISWKADYIVVVNSDDTVGDLSGWVTIDNTSGATYKDAQLKLVAGEVNRAQPPMMKAYRGAMAMEMNLAADKSQFQEQSFFEYHIYDLQRKATIKNNQTKQINLLDASGIKLVKEYVVQSDQQYFWGNWMNQSLKPSVNVKLKFKNAKDNRLGMPLPAGIIRLYKEDSKKSQQFIGEDNIKHTPKDEEVEVKVGEAFDVVAERVQMDYQQNNRSYESQWQITLRNHKEQGIKVIVKEPVAGDWTVLQSSVPYKKQDASTIRFEVDVPKDGQVQITYRIRVKT